MSCYYPDRIADDDDDNLSCNSAEIEGCGVGSGVAPDAVAANTISNNDQSSIDLPPSDDLNSSVKNNIGTPHSAASRKSRPWIVQNSPDEQACSDDELCNDDLEMEVSRHGESDSSDKETLQQLDLGTGNKEHKSKEMNGGEDISDKNAGEDEQKWMRQEKDKQMAHLIEHERQRRLGIHNESNSSANNQTNNSKTEQSHQNQNNSGGRFRHIRDWFGGGGGDDGNNQNQRSSAPAISPVKLNTSSHDIPPQGNNKGSNATHRGSVPFIPGLHAEDSHRSGKSNKQNQIEESSSDDLSSDDSDSSSTQSGDDWSSNSIANFDMDQNHATTTPQERARMRALRYLSNSCVDAGRKAKTASYIRGLERLDLKRKRDRYEKELDVVESEMNKDRGAPELRVGKMGNENGNGEGEEGREEMDAVSEMASKLVLELPLLKSLLGKETDADAGAGSDKGNSNSNSKCCMSFDDYADALNAFDSNGMSSDNDAHPSSLWKNKEAVDIYVAFLQRRYKEALEKTRSFEKRLTVLEQTGDEIVSSLCEDLVDITEHSNKTEAEFVKKGKELQRKRRREEVRHRKKVKQAESRIQNLEERLLSVSGGGSRRSLNDSDSSKSDSTLEGDDEEEDEIRLEKKLSTIKAKNEEDKAAHLSEVDSIRRQCEQLKLRLSVTRLVMEGDDNLREYIAILDRLNPSTQHQRHNHIASYDDSSYNDYDFSGIHRAAIPPPPSSRITRARAKLLKATHLLRIYEQRLAVSKAFTDAAINALEQELSEREESGQKMEVRCLNELMIIDSEMKDIVKESSDKIAELEAEAQRLEDAIGACFAEKSINGVNNMFVGDGEASTAAMNLLKPATEVEISTVTDSPSVASAGKKNTEDLRGGKSNNQAIKNDEAHDESACDRVRMHTRAKSKEETADMCSDSVGDKIEEEFKEGSNDNCGDKVLTRNPDEHSENKKFDSENHDDLPSSETIHDNRSQKENDGRTEMLPTRPLAEDDSDSEFLGDIDATDQGEVFNDEKDASTNETAGSDVISKEKEEKDNATAPLLFEAEGKVCNGNLDNLGAMDPEQKAVLQLLGRELKYTLSDYQTGFDLSTSSERLQQLEYMNNVVLKIAKVRGIKLSPKMDSTREGDFKSWSLRPKKERKGSEDGDESRREKKRLKKKKKRRRRNREKAERYEASMSLKSILQDGSKDKDGIGAKNVFITTHNQSLLW